MSHNSVDHDAMMIDVSTIMSIHRVCVIIDHLRTCSILLTLITYVYNRMFECNERSLGLKNYDFYRNFYINFYTFFYVFFILFLCFFILFLCFFIKIL